MGLQSSAQHSSQNENIVNTSKKLLKTRYRTFLESSTLNENLRFSQIYCQCLQLPDLKVCDGLPSTRIKKMPILHHLQRGENLVFYLLQLAFQATKGKRGFIATKYVQNVIFQKIFSNNLFQFFPNFFHFSLGFCQF